MLVSPDFAVFMSYHSFTFKSDSHMLISLILYVLQES